MKLYKIILCNFLIQLMRPQKDLDHTAHSKVLVLSAYLKVIFCENMGFSLILGSNGPN